jgi:hypothetical protein
METGELGGIGQGAKGLSISNVVMTESRSTGTLNSTR